MLNPLQEPIAKLVLERHLLPLSEHELISQLVRTGCLAADYARDSLALFQAHFLAMNALYQLRSSLRGGNQWDLRVSPLVIELLPLAPLSAETKVVSASADWLADYYLDWQNFRGASLESVDTLLTTFWNRYFSHGKVDTALSVLNLNAPVDWTAIKSRYRTLAMQMHPDRGGDKAEFARLQGAYATLKLQFQQPR